MSIPRLRGATRTPIYSNPIERAAARVAECERTGSRWRDPENGRQCPTCAEIYELPHSAFGECDQIAHDDPNDCIKHLRERLEQVESALERHNF